MAILSLLFVIVLTVIVICIQICKQCIIISISVVLNAAVGSVARMDEWSYQPISNEFCVVDLAALCVSLTFLAFDTSVDWLGKYVHSASIYGHDDLHANIFGQLE